MNGKKSIGRKSFIVGFMGILALILILIAVIVQLEPDRPGITRAEASKAAALFMASRAECIQYKEEGMDSHFQEKEQDNWYVLYMDYLYDHGGLKEADTEASQKAAGEEITYKEASTLAGILGSQYASMVNLNDYNQEDAFPAELWWQIYEKAVKDLDGEGVECLDLVLYGTPANVEDSTAWTCYTSAGDFQFEGLVLDPYLDLEIRLFVRDGEVAGVGQVLSDEVCYENVWIDQAEGGFLSVHTGTIRRQFAIPEEAPDSGELLHNVADLYLKSGKLSKVTVKKERIRATVLAVGEDFVELDGYGRLETVPGFRVYKIYGEYEEQNRSSILVGYDLQEFVAEKGKLCAALTVTPFNADRIRVLLLDDNLASAFHGQVTFTLDCDGILSYGDEEKQLKQVKLTAGSPFTIMPGDVCLQEGRAVVTPDAGDGHICIDSLNRSQGAPVYSGILEIRQGEKGIVLVNELPLEDYLKKVVPSEMPVNYEIEALKAQAICARTYAYRQIMGNSYSQYGAHVDDSTSYQVYNNGETDQATDQAVDETCGKVLFYGEKPAETYYYSTSCGHGTDGSVWGGSGTDTPYLKAVALQDSRTCLDLASNESFAAFIKDMEVPAFDAKFPLYRWYALYKGTTLGNKLGMAQIHAIEIKERGPGGIAKKMVVTDVTGDQRTFSGQMEIRRALGSRDLEIQRQDGKEEHMSLLPSAFIAVEEAGTAKDGSKLFKIWGGGYGHGAGMSQNGAQGMAKEGKTYQEILNFFYEGTELRDGAGTGLQAAFVEE